MHLQFQWLKKNNVNNFVIFEPLKYEGQKTFKSLYFNKRYLVAFRNFTKKTSTVKIITLDGSISLLYNCIITNKKEEESIQSAAYELEGGSV